jgi:hypothetical protein
VREYGLSDERCEVIVVFTPLSRVELDHLDRRGRASLLREQTRQWMKQMLDDLRTAGMVDEVDLLDGNAGERAPAGAVLLKATPRALARIRKLPYVAAVADSDTPLPMWPLSV